MNYRERILWAGVGLAWLFISVFAILSAAAVFTGCAAPSQSWYQSQALQASIDNASNQAALNSTIDSIGQRR